MFQTFLHSKNVRRKKDIHAFKAAIVLWLKSISIQDHVESCRVNTSLEKQFVEKISTLAVLSRQKGFEMHNQNAKRS